MEITENLNSKKMGEKPILKLLIEMSLPAMISMFVLSLYNIVDSYFVGLYSQSGLEALSIVFPMQQLQIAFSVGIGVGTNAFVSRQLGQGKIAEANLTAQTGLFMSICGGLIFILIGLFASERFVSAFSSDSEVIQMGTVYLKLVMCLSIGSFIDITANKVLQATGNMKIPMITQLLGAVVNIVFGPIFIFVFKWGIAGAAIATVLGQFCSMTVLLLAFKFKKQDVSVFFNKNFRFRAAAFKGIIKIGFPVMVMNAVASVVTTVFNLILKAFKNAITVLGLYFKLQSFAFMPVFGLTQGALPIMSYTYGARNKKRFVEAYKWSIIIAIGIMSVCVVLFEAIPGQLLSLFSKDAELIKMGIFALRVISICFIMAAYDIISTTMLQALRLGFASMIVSLLRQIILLVPLAFLFTYLWGVDGFWFAYPVSEIIVAIIFLFTSKTLLNKKFSETELRRINILEEIIINE